MSDSTQDWKKVILSEALHKARNAVFFDERGNYADAIRAYGESCALLGKVMGKPLKSLDREKVEAIVSNDPKRTCEHVLHLEVANHLHKANARTSRNLGTNVA